MISPVEAVRNINVYAQTWVPLGLKKSQTMLVSKITNLFLMAMDLLAMTFINV
jgi:hypothetical protein